MSGYRTKDVVADPAGVTAPASVVTAISKEFPIRDGRQTLIIDVSVTATTVTNAVSLKAQGRLPDGSWVDMKSTSVANAFTGVKTQTYAIEIAGDQANYPLRTLVRVVADCGASDTVTVNHVWVTAAWGGQN